jgi:xanthine dehydrogenase accessory factor
LNMHQIGHARQFGAQDETEVVVVEEITAPQRLIVFGAGDDAKPFVRFASLLGWDVTVADQRPQLARKERFPDAACVFMGKAEKDLSVSPEDAVVVMTHSYEQDKELLELTLAKNPRSVGLLGARHCSSMLIYEVSSLLGWSVEEVCRRINAPVGLDIGGDGPEAIALAILSEVQTRCQGKPCRSRKLSVDQVFQYAGKGDTACLAKTSCSERDFG